MYLLIKNIIYSLKLIKWHFKKNLKKNCTFNVYCYSKNLHNFLSSKYALYRGTLKILNVLETKFFEKFCANNKHYYSKKLHNNVCLKYAIFRRMLNLSHVQHTQFFKNKIAHPTNTMTQTIYIILLVRIMQFFE